MCRAACTVYYPYQQMHKTFHWPCIFYVNSLEDYVHKTVQSVYGATKQKLRRVVINNVLHIVFYHLTTIT